MREIKFRAWDKSNKEMIFDNFKITSSGEIETFGIYSHIEVMQFTGLKDKNGKEIYDGDIMKTFFVRSFGKNDVWYEKLILVEVEKDVWGYRFYWRTLKEIKRESGKKLLEEINKFGLGIIIIGNKFENPELLK